MAHADVPSPRRSPIEDSRARTEFLDAAQQLILEDGYAAVTARRVAARAGRKPQLVHYYFSSMDDLFVQLVRRGAAHGQQRLAAALEDTQPLWALWKLSTEPEAMVLSTEYVALAHHRKAVAKEVSEAGTRFRLAQYDAFRTALTRYDVETGGISTAALLVGLEGMARVIVMERRLGTTTFHAEAIATIEGFLTQIEGPDRSS